MISHFQDGLFVSYAFQMEFSLSDSLGAPLSATVEVEPASIVLHSRGGTKGAVGSRNQDYAEGLRLMLQRLIDHRLQIIGAWVDSSRVQHLSLQDRQILFSNDLPTTASDLFSLIGKRMETVGQAAVAEKTKGNRNKRIRILLSAGSVDEIADAIGAIPKVSVPRHALRLPVKDLRGERGGRDAEAAAESGGDLNETPKCFARSLRMAVRADSSP
jgi:hypothetical protein